MKRLIIAALLCSSVVYAQPAPTLPQSAPVSPPPEITLKVTQPELDLISEGLQSQPFGKVVPLINKLRTQIMEQIPKPVAPPVEAPK